MSPESRVEYPVSSGFPVLQTEYHKFYPFSPPDFPELALYETREEATLGGYTPECFFVRQTFPGSEDYLITPSSSDSVGSLLRKEVGCNLWEFGLRARKTGKGITLGKSGIPSNRFFCPVWIVNGSQIRQKDWLFESAGLFSEEGIAVIPVIFDHPKTRGIILCKQEDLAVGLTREFIEKILSNQEIKLKGELLEIPQK